MKIFVSLRRHDAMRKARDWFAARANYAVFEAITEWARGKEEKEKWGECFMLVEVDLPGSRGMNARNIDCVIAFSDRVAVIEVKGHHRLKSAQASLSETLRQCCASFDLVSAHLAGIVHDKAIRPFVFMPELGSNEIAQLNADQLSKDSLSHPVIAGGFRCAAKPSLPNGHPLFIVRALQSRLGSMADSDPRRFTRDAQATLLRLIDPADRYEFSALDRAVEALQRHGSTPSATRLPEHYVRRLRAAELDQFSELFNQKRTVEVCGAPGIGKSDFIREALEQEVTKAKRDTLVAVVDVKATHTLHALCRELLSCFGQEPDDAEDERSLLERLAQTDGVIWIPTYDTEARAVISRLIDSLATFSERACRLVIESHETPGSQSECEQMIDLLRLDSASILQILKRAEPGRSDHSVTDVARNSRGNPRLALTHWKSGRLNPVPDWLASNFLWLERTFADPVDRAICFLVVALLDDCLLPMSPRLLEATATAVFRGVLPSRAKRSVAKALAYLDASSMLHLRFFDASRYRVLSLLPEDATRGAMRVFGLDTTLAEYVIRQTDVAQLREWNEHFDAVLKTRQDEPKHANVLLSLRHNEITTWFASVFRQGLMHLDDVVRWLDRRVVKRTSTSTSVDELYLERALRLAQALRTKRTPDIAAELGEPPDGFRWPRYAYKLLTTLTTSPPGPPAVDLALDGDDLDVAVEAACWKVMLGSAHDWPSWWICFREVLSTADRLAPAVRLQVYHYSLMCATFCGRDFVQQTPATRALLTDICRELAALAIKENMMYLFSAEAFFVGLLEPYDRFDPLSPALFVKEFAREASLRRWEQH